LIKEASDQTNDLVSDTEVLENLIFISNGSPGKLLEYLKIWNQIPANIKCEIKFPLKDYENILFLAKNITTHLNLNQQEFLLDYIQRNWWKKTKDKKTAEIIEAMKVNIISNIQPRLAWEVGLLKVRLEDS